MTDAFAPHDEPARSIYLALQNEASKRGGRAEFEWTTAERLAVHEEACRQARKLRLRTPTIADVERAERMAFGSTDYAAKWVYGVTEAMLRA